MSSSSYIGIDIAKATLAVATSEGYLTTVENTKQGHSELLKLLSTLRVKQVTLEETGIYGRAIVKTLQQKGYRVSSVSPSRIRSFAQALGTLAKTDPIDAQVIAQFGESIKPRESEMREEHAVHLRALIDRRQQLKDDLTRERNRLEACQNTCIMGLLKQSINRLVDEIKQLDQMVAQAIKEHEPFREMSKIMLEVKGVGIQTVAIILAMVPEIGHLNRQKLGKLVGLAPLDKSSGEMDAPRHIKGGRSRVRKILFMAGLSATRSNDVLKPFYNSLVNRGKAKKVAVIACTRKLLIHINSLMHQYFNGTHSKNETPASP